MSIHWMGFVWTLVAVLLAVFVYRMSGQKGTI